MVTAKDLAKFLYTSLQENPKKQEDITVAFLEFIEEKNLLSLLSHVVVYVEKFEKADKDKKTLKIILQREHNTSVIKDIKTKIAYLLPLDGKQATPDKVETEIIIDENIKGGFVAQYNNVIFDASVATQLLQIKNKLVN